MKKIMVKKHAVKRVFYILGKLSKAVYNINVLDRSLICKYKYEIFHI